MQAPSNIASELQIAIVVTSLVSTSINKSGLPLYTLLNSTAAVVPPGWLPLMTENRIPPGSNDKVGVRYGTFNTAFQ